MPSGWGEEQKEAFYDDRASEIVEALERGIVLMLKICFVVKKIEICGIMIAYDCLRWLDE